MRRYPRHSWNLKYKYNKEINNVKKISWKTWSKPWKKIRILGKSINSFEKYFCLNATSSRWKKYWTIDIYFDIFSDRFCGLSLLLSYSKKVNVRAIIDLSTREYAVPYIFKNVYHAEQSFMPVAFSICSFSKNTHEWKSKEKRKSTLQNSS